MTKRIGEMLWSQAPSEDAEDYLRDKLNYEKVDHTPTKYGEIYMLPVKMVKE